jgi:uncharacterized membrane protein
MISPVRVTQTFSESSTIAGAARARRPSPSRQAHLRPRSLTQERAREYNESPLDSRWVIVIGIAMFIGVKALLMLQV